MKFGTITFFGRRKNAIANDTTRATFSTIFHIKPYFEKALDAGDAAYFMAIGFFLGFQE